MNKQAKQSGISKLNYVLIALIFLLSIFFATTLAYFTSQDSKTGSVEFGTINLNVSNDDIVTVSSSRLSGKLLPGDEVIVNFDIENTGEDAYYLVALKVDGLSSVGLDGVTGIYAGKIDTDANKVANKVGDITNETTKKVGAISAGNTEKNTKTCNLDFLGIDNSMMEKQAKITINVYAIQQANMGATDADAQANAFDKLLELMKGDFDPNVPVIVDGVKYYYDAETDSFTVGNYFTLMEDAGGPTGEMTPEIAAKCLSGFDESLVGKEVLTIKSEINGKPVTKIADMAFLNMEMDESGNFTGNLGNLTFTTVVIEGNISYLGQMAFTGNVNMTKLLICGDLYVETSDGLENGFALVAGTQGFTGLSVGVKKGVTITGIIAEGLASIESTTTSEHEVNGENVIFDMYSFSE